MSNDFSSQSFPVGFAQATDEFFMGDHNTPVSAACILFTDRAVLILTTNGRLGQFLSIAAGHLEQAGADLDDQDTMNMLPDTDLTPDWILGASDTARSDMVGLLSVQITSALMLQGLHSNQRILFGFNLPGNNDYWQDESEVGVKAANARRSIYLRLIALSVQVYKNAKRSL